MNYAESCKKQALLAYKQKLINDLKYLDERLNEARSKPKQIDEDCSSSDDSDIDLTKSIILGPSFSALKRDQTKLKTCLQATQELTSLQVLDSEINLQVDEPVIKGAPVVESGNWYEVVAECRLDLVQFLITFFVHRSSRKFGPVHYRNLEVTAVKKAHENELSSGLETLTKPADAIEIINQYAEEHRSRRNSLARLADAFAGKLRMAPMPEGGYAMQYLDFLEILWLIKYSKSRVRFQHALKFDIDHLEEKYIMVIKAAYEQLNNTTSTEKRTALLEKIIRTCIEASGRTDFGESTDQSDQEVVDKLIQKPALFGVNKKDSEMMAPPKSLPKKSKSKGKENKDRNAVANNNDEVSEVPAKKTKKDDSVNAKDVATKKSNVEQKNNSEISAIKAKKDSTVDVIVKSVDAAKTKDVPKNTNDENTKSNEIPAQKSKKDVEVNVKSIDVAKTKDVTKKINVEKKMLKKPEVPVKKTKRGSTAGAIVKSVDKTKEVVLKKKNVEKTKSNEISEVSAKKHKKNTTVNVNKKPVQTKTKDISKKSNVEPKKVSSANNMETDIKSVPETRSGDKLIVAEKTKKHITPANETFSQDKDNVIEQNKKLTSENVSSKEGVQEKSKKKITPVNSKSKNNKEIIKIVDQNTKSVAGNKDTQKPTSKKNNVGAVINKPNTNSVDKNTKSKEVDTTTKQKTNVNVKSSSDDKNKKTPKPNKVIKSTSKIVKNVSKIVSKIPKFKPSNSKDSENGNKVIVKPTTKIPSKDSMFPKSSNKIMSPNTRYSKLVNKVIPINNKLKLPQKVTSAAKVNQNIPTKAIELAEVVENQRISGNKRKLSIVDRVSQIDRAVDAKIKSIPNLQTLKRKIVNSVTKNKVSKFS